MAEPTVWGFTAVAGTSTSFPIEGTNVYGVDISGALTPTRVTLAPGIILLVTAGATDDEVVAAMLPFIRRYEAGRESAGGERRQGTVQTAPALFTTTTV